jgi:hypothetical protein
MLEMRGRVLLIWAIFVMALLLPMTAVAQTEESVEQCFRAYEETQVELKAARFARALHLAGQCSTGCPQEISEQCQIWARQADRDAPSVLLFARFEDGKDAPGITVEVDGKESRLQEELLLDPGQHTIVFRRADGWEEALDVTIYRGEKRRPIRSIIPAETGKVAPPPQAKSHAQRNWAIVAFSVGALGIGVATTGTLMALDQRASLDECAEEGCDPRDVDRAKTTLLVADIGAVVGAIGVISGVAILIWGNPAETKSKSATLSFSPTPGGGAGILSARF